MSVFLDDRPFSATGLPPNATVEQVCGAASASLAGTGRILMTVRCGQDDVTGGQLDALMGEPAARFGRLDLVSARPAEAVLDALVDAAAMLADTFTLVTKAAEALREGRVGEAMTGLGECALAWGRIHEGVVRGGALLGLNYATLNLSSRPMVTELAAWADGLRDVKQALEARDHVLLGDILNYEFDDRLRQWEAALHGLIAHVRRLEVGAVACPESFTEAERKEPSSPA